MDNLQKGIDYIGVCVVYFCHNGKGDFVMAKRSKNARDEKGTWDIGGGGVEFDQTVEQALRNEIREEYCTDVKSYEFLGYRDVHRVNNKKKTHWIALDFKVEVDSKKVQIGEPHKFDDLKWFTSITLPKNLHSQLPTFFKLYKAKLK